MKKAKDDLEQRRRQPRNEESIRKALKPTGGVALAPPAKTNRNKLKCVSYKKVLAAQIGTVCLAEEIQMGFRET